MGMKAVALLLIAASSTSGLNIEVKIQNDPQCQFKGQQCSADLRQIIYCSSKGGNSYVVSTCDPGTSCRKNDAGDYICSKQQPETPTGNGTVFTCQGTETYPDPYRCNTAYICETTGGFPTVKCECPEGSALVFTPGMTCTSDKDVKEDCKCPFTDRCKDGDIVGGFDNCHTQHYYICRSDSKGGRVPEVYKCPQGEVFVNGKCEKPIVPAINLTEITGNGPVCKTYHAPCYEEPNVKCTKKGELLPHGKIDRCYYACDASLKPISKDCGIGSYFTCKYGQCGCVFGPKPQ